MGSLRGFACALVGASALSLACAGSQPELMEEVPSAEVLYQEGLEILEGDSVFLFFDHVNYTKAIETFQAIIDNYPYSDYAILAELKIADSYFDDESYDAALQYYRDFAELHPNHEQVPYAVFRAALCHYRQARDPIRDQTATRNALLQLDRLMSEHPSSTHVAEAEALWRELRTRLAKHVMHIADFYMNREEYQSSVDRYREVLSDYPGLGLDAEALYKLGQCYTKMNREDEAARIYEVILRNYEGTEVAEAAADLVPAAN